MLRVEPENIGEFKTLLATDYQN